MVSLPNVTELRWIVVAPTSMVPVWKTWQDFDDARDSDKEMEESAKAFNEMLESPKRPLHEHTEKMEESVADGKEPAM